MWTNLMLAFIAYSPGVRGPGNLRASAAADALPRESGAYLRAVDRADLPPWARKVRVGANSPSLWPTISSVM
jgi:hypothetical protein